MLSFMSGAAVTLAWAVMESSWRNAHMDELTNLPGRRSLKHHFGSLGSSYAVAVLDVDRFKKINDKYGHDTGDEVLRFIAGHLRKNTAGRAYRYGGEEFVIVSEGDAFDDTVSCLEELRKAICRDRFEIRGKGRWRRKLKQSACVFSGSTQVAIDQRPHPAPMNRATESITITVSIGVARSSHKYSSPSEVLEVADKALYQAKKDGRNNTKVMR